MGISREQIEHVALLARLELDERTQKRQTEQLADILEYIAKLNELDTEDVEPLSHPGELSNVFRPDELRSSLERGQSLDNAPHQQDGFFKVPRIIE